MHSFQKIKSYSWSCGIHNWAAAKIWYSRIMYKKRKKRYVKSSLLFESSYLEEMWLSFHTALSSYPSRVLEIQHLSHWSNKVTTFRKFTLFFKLNFNFLAWVLNNFIIISKHCGLQTPTGADAVFGPTQLSWKFCIFV